MALTKKQQFILYSLGSWYLEANKKLKEQPLEIAISKNPGSGDTALKLGEAYLKDGQMMKAIESLAKSVMLFAQESMTQQQAQGQNSLGKAKFDMGEYKSDPALQNDGRVVQQVDIRIVLDAPAQLDRDAMQMCVVELMVAGHIHDFLVGKRVRCPFQSMGMGVDVPRQTDDIVCVRIGQLEVPIISEQA